MCYLKKHTFVVAVVKLYTHHGISFYFKTKRACIVSFNYGVWSFITPKWLRMVQYTNEYLYTPHETFDNCTIEDFCKIFFVVNTCSKQVRIFLNLLILDTNKYLAIGEEWYLTLT